jgi:hypothetical protein
MLLALLAGMPVAPSGGVITAAAGGCGVRGCSCTHLPGHAANCPCCASGRRSADGAGASVAPCHCGLDREAASATPAQTEAVLANPPSWLPVRMAGELAVPLDERASGIVADAPEPVPRLSLFAA